MNFWYKTNSSSDILTILNRFKKLNRLGERICIGTYLPDSTNITSILNSKDICKNYNVVGISVVKETRPQIIEEYNHLLGEGNYMVSLVSIKDISNGNSDVPKKRYKTIDVALSKIY